MSAAWSIAVSTIGRDTGTAGTTTSAASSEATSAIGDARMTVTGTGTIANTKAIARSAERTLAHRTQHSSASRLFQRVGGLSVSSSGVGRYFGREGLQIANPQSKIANAKGA